MAELDRNVVLNIVPIFNTATNDGGLDNTASATAAIAAIQTMVDPTTYTISANDIKSFNTGTIELLNNTNVTGSLTVNGQPLFTLAGSNFEVSSANLYISTGAIGFYLLSTPITSNEVGGFQLYASTVFSIDTNNNFLFQPYISNYGGGSVTISSMPFIADTSIISSLILNSLQVRQSTLLKNLYVSGLAEIPVFLGYSTVISSLTTLGYSRFTTTSTLLGQFGHVTASTLEVANPLRQMVVSSLFSSTSTTGILSLSDRLTSAGQKLYSSSNILYFNGAPIGGTLSYAFETLSF